MSDLLKLAERCEKATGPDRELDVAIAKLLGWKTRPHMDKHWHSDVWVEPNNGWQAELPYFTGSIDAALTLVPEDAPNLKYGATVWTGSRSAARIFYERRDISAEGGWAIGACSTFEIKAATPALALCAAALRAREALTRTGRAGT